MAVNQYNQVIGEFVKDWSVRKRPIPCVRVGKYCNLNPLSFEQHVKQLYHIYDVIEADKDWTYLPYEFPNSEAKFKRHVQSLAQNEDLVNFVIIDSNTQSPIGMIALMRIDPLNGVIEIGHVN